MTAQVHERLIYEGEEMSMMSCPPLPTHHPRVVEVGHPWEATAREGVPDIIFSTACWRGYLGTWAITEGRLYLVGLQGRVEMTGDGPIFAGWVSGRLRVARGALLEYVHMGFQSVYERELIIKLEAGVVVATKTVENRRPARETLTHTRSWWRRLTSLVRR
jgi:hypothetical protein